MNSGKLTLSAALLSFLMLTSILLKAQDRRPENKHLGWLSYGLGATSNGFLTGYSLNYQYNRSVFSLQMYGEVKDPRSQFPDVTGDFSVLYGISSNTNNLFVGRILAGIGGVTRSYFENVVAATLFGEELEKVEVVKQTVGFPIRAELMLNAKFVAFGLTGLANINSLNTYTGLMFTVQIGLMR